MRSCNNEQRGCARHVTRNRETKTWSCSALCFPSPDPLSLAQHQNSAGDYNLPVVPLLRLQTRKPIEKDESLGRPEF